MDLNKVMLIGRLTRDPEVKQISTGQTVASFGMATNMSWTDKNGQKQDKVEFHNIVAWRGLADVCGRYLKKGSKVYIEGRLQTRDWQAQDGTKRYTTEITAENMIMLDNKGGGNTGQNFQQPTSKPAQTPTINYDEPTGAGEDEIKVENIPF